VKTILRIGRALASFYCGLGSNGLPVGLHIIGGQYRDSRVLAAAAAFETAFGRATYPI
jgi:Asp-tRNA(Asn)/Glu-tRNA(Gln) amidotransferase A subunit family amidase